MNTENDDTIDKAKVRALLEIWLKALTQKDVDAVMAEYAPDIPLEDTACKDGKPVPVAACESIAH